MRLQSVEKLLLALAALSFLGAAAILVSRGLSGGAPPPPTSCRLADGSTLSVAEVRWGRTLRYTPRVSWRRAVLRRFWPARYPPPTVVSSVEWNEPLLGIWLTRVGVPAANHVVLQSAPARDSHGCFFPAALCDDQVRSDRPSGQERLVFVGLSQFPRRERTFCLQFRDSSARPATS